MLNKLLESIKAFFTSNSLENTDIQVEDLIW